MKPSRTNHRQGRLFEQRLSDQLNPNHELCILADVINWPLLETEFNIFFDEERGKFAKPVRLVVGIMLLQHMYALSDEAVVAHWTDNPYWQLFCGYDYLQWQFPIHPTTLTRWRQRLGEGGMEKILGLLIDGALKVGAVERSSLKKVIVDTTVMPKAIAYPTDAKLFCRALKRLVDFAKRENLFLRQTYSRLAPKILRRINQLFHARKNKQAKKEIKRLKGYCGRVFREILRFISKDSQLEKRAAPVLSLIGRLLLQGQEDENKIYSLHEPHVECISKGKVHKKYEFGCKTSIVVTHKEGFVVGAYAIHGNRYDGHTLQKALEQTKELTGKKVEQAYVDKGYRGNGIKDCDVRISGSKRKWNWRQLRDLKRRQAIEPHIGHMKNDGKLGRNFLKGILGDKIHAILCGVGHNMRLLCNFIRFQRAFSLG
jgi:transposase, IS5 family